VAIKYTTQTFCLLAFLGGPWRRQLLVGYNRSSFVPFAHSSQVERYEVPHDPGLEEEDGDQAVDPVNKAQVPITHQ